MVSPRRLLPFLALLALAWGLEGAERRRPLVVGMGIGYAPYEYLDLHGQPAGFVPDLVRAVAAKQGLDVSFRPMPFAHQQQALERGEVDLLAGLALSPDREARFDTCVIHSTVSYGIVVRARDWRIRSRRDLRGKVVLGIQGGLLPSLLNQENCTTKAFPTHEMVLLALAAGLGDCAVVPKHTLSSYLRSGSVKGLVLVPMESFSLRRSFALRKEDKPLLDQLNQGLFAIQASGELSRIHDRHLGPLELTELSFTQGFRRVRRPFLLGALLLLTGGAAVWILTLRGTVRRRTAALRAEVEMRRTAELEAARLAGERESRNEVLQSTIQELCRALAEVEQLSGLIPICAECKSVRDDQGYWTAVEAFVGSRSGATFTHGLCPCCVERHRASLDYTNAGEGGTACSV